MAIVGGVAKLLTALWCATVLTMALGIAVAAAQETTSSTPADPAVAAEVDRRILQAWQSHPRRFIVESTSEFLDKAAETLDILRGEMPDCCKRHVVQALRARQSEPTNREGTASD